MNARITPIRTDAENALVAAFADAHSDLAGSAAVAQWRDEAMSTFVQSGLPHRRVEAWHYTDLRAAWRDVLPLAAAPSAATIEDVRRTLDAQAPRIADVLRLVLVDGVYVPHLSDGAKIPAGVGVRTLADVMTSAEPAVLEALPKGAFGSDDAALALNNAFMNGGLVIEVAEGTRVDRPIELVSIASNAQPHSFFTRSLVRVGEDAALTLIEAHVADASTAVQKNDALVFDLADRAEVEHVATFSSIAANSIHVSTLAARLGERARLTSFALVTGAGLLRRQGFVRFEGTDAKAMLGGVDLLRARQHADTTLVVHHIAPRCESREFFRHILEGEATGVFQGKIVVAPGAQKTDGAMKSQAILLSETATMNNKPELEIFADDVVCGHGATCGELDADQVFYVRSRGVPRPDAEALLLEAFAAAAVDRIESVPLRDTMLGKIKAWLAERRC